MKLTTFVEFVVNQLFFTSFTNIATTYSTNMKTLIVVNSSIVSTSTSTSKKRVMFNDIIIYDDSSIYNRLSIVVKAYFEIWKNIDDIVNISKKNWMIIFIIENAKSKTHKIYSLFFENKKLIDEKFDKFHAQNKMQWINAFTFYDFFCFVVWRTMHLSNKSSKKNVS